jgi:hypothetical protein
MGHLRILLRLLLLGLELLRLCLVVVRFMRSELGVRVARVA